MIKSLSLLSTLLLISCGGPQQVKTKKLSLPETVSGKTSVLVVGANLTDSFKKDLRDAGVDVSGETILRLTGEAHALNDLDIPADDQFDFTIDTAIDVQKSDFGAIDENALYLAKKDFGILDFWKKYPQADGRGVIVGVIDDGISPNQIGFSRTSTGERKFLAKSSQSTFSTYPLEESEEGFTALIKEGNGFSGKLDLNQDGVIGSFKSTISADGEKVCLDLDLNEAFSSDECKGTFKKTGEFFVLPKNKSLVIMAEVDLEKKEIKILQPELADDSHGEGVASVMASYRQGNLPGFDGVAPGAQIADYDLSENTNKPQENEYTLGTFLLALDWLAKEGAEVANVSYSLFYTNAKSQAFMAKALAAIVEKHNIVISFSAGNNGPGLGSLNRRMMYPSSVMVAGAYVSKELDERVWGTTGLPDEGRVVYYSSRGAGAGSVGPTMISPLSSLTHSSSSTGYRAFNGTSSASPALAGAAAVLISAIKQENLKVHADTVVQAMRLSSKRLENEPFISQGYGLPQIEKALNIYRELITGQKFSSVAHTVNRGGLDGTSGQGIVVKKSEASSVESYRVTLAGQVSSLAPADATTNLLVPVEIQYSKGISGARELWISVSASRVSVDVEIDELLGNKREAFGEIRIIAKDTKELLAIIPVTAINDMNAGSLLREQLTVSAQEGSRLHINVPEGVKALKVRARLMEGESRFLNAAAYSPDFIRTHNMAMFQETFIPTPKAGHYQLTLMMVQGTKRSATVEFEVEEVRMDLLTSDAQSAGKLTVANSSSSPLQGDLKLTPKAKVLKTILFDNKSIPEATMTLPKGNYQVGMFATGQHDLSYLYGNCSIMEKKEETFEATTSTVFVNSKDEDVTLKFRCVPFDYAIEGNDDLLWKMVVTSPKAETKLRLDTTGGSRKTLRLPQLEAGIYEVGFTHGLSGQNISLGSIEIY